MANHRDVWVRIDESNGYSHGDYSALREALAPEYAEWDDASIENLVENLYPGASPADVENFFKTLKKVGKSAAKIGQRALPGIMQGAATGGMFGPIGAVVGGVAGGALSAATSGRGRRGGGGGGIGGALGGIARKIPGIGGIAQQLPGIVQQLPGLAQRIPGLAGSPAAAQFLRTINRPEVGQALRSLTMGGAGRRNVNVGGMSIPTGAITSTLRHLLERVETELHENSAGESAGTPLYLLSSDGEFAVDPTDEAARAEHVLEILAATESAGDPYDSSRYESFQVENVSEDDEWSEDDEISPEDEARLLYPGVYESTVED